MAADSPLRRVLKRVLYPVLNEGTYQYVQAASKAWDIYRGTWSEKELAFVPRLVRKGESAIDIGANYGLYAQALSKAVGPKGRVYAFEPIPATAGALRLVAKMLRFEHNVEIIDKGCGDKPGELSFNIPISPSGTPMAGVVHLSARDNRRAGKEQHARFEEVKTVKCEVVTIDQYLGHVDNLSFIKCDIEGADYFALKGAEKTIEKHRPAVLVEINPWMLAGFGIKLADLIGFFSDRGYGTYVVEAHGVRRVPLEQVVDNNYLFLTDAHLGRLGS